MSTEMTPEEITAARTEEAIRAEAAARAESERLAGFQEEAEAENNALDAVEARAQGAAMDRARLQAEAEAENSERDELAEAMAAFAAANANAQTVNLSPPPDILEAPKGHFGPTLKDELFYADVHTMAFVFTDDKIIFGPGISADDRAAVVAVVEAHDPSKSLEIQVESVSAAQAKTALFNGGFLDDVETIVTNHPYRPVKIFFENANVWEKSNPYVRAIAVELDLLKTDADGNEIDNGLDLLFISADML